MGSVCTKNDEVTVNDEVPVDRKERKTKKKKTAKKGADNQFSLGPKNSTFGIAIWSWKYKWFRNSLSLE